MRSYSPQTIATLDDLAFRVATHGVDSERGAVSRVVRRAATLGADPVLTDIVVDPREPAVARQRAFGELLSILGRRPAAPASTTPQASEHDVAWPAHAA
jgi:hypothetical protein